VEDKEEKQENVVQQEHQVQQDQQEHQVQQVQLCVSAKNILLISSAVAYLIAYGFFEDNTPRDLSSKNANGFGEDGLGTLW
jgi:hypothetical protein